MTNETTKAVELWKEAIFGKKPKSIVEDFNEFYSEHIKGTNHDIIFIDEDAWFSDNWWSNVK